MVWNDDTPGNGEIYFKKSADGGATWQSDKRLTNSAASSYVPDIAANSSSICLVWLEGDSGLEELFFKKSINGGSNWQVRQQLTSGYDRPGTPKIAINGANIYLVCSMETPVNREIYFSKSTDGGATWKDWKTLSTSSTNAWVPDITCSGANLYVIWNSDSTGNHEVYFRMSTNGGDTWQSQKRLTYNSGNSKYAAVAAGGSGGTGVHAVWEDDTPGNLETYFRRSTDSGATWKTSKRFTFNSGSSRMPAVAASGSDVFAGWMDDTPGNYEIYFRRSADAGVNWQDTERLTNTAGDSSWPKIALNAAKVYVVYADSTPGNNEIYLKYSPL